MSRVKTRPDADEMDLFEYNVGRAGRVQVFPGLMVCFAIFGVTGDRLIGTHVSPEATQQELDDTFARMGILGGAGVTCWYVVGPCSDHYKSSKAIWKKDKHVGKAIKDAFAPARPIVMLRDAFAERHTPITIGTMTTSYRGLDLRAERAGPGVRLQYREYNGDKTWQDMALTGFKRL